ncbi:leucyl aminopeptidase [Candidatus Woesearchaeota archaeon]|nr:leucyl aminopeptidase [Candidatus Woesearchaeota archaeon]
MNIKLQQEGDFTTPLFILPYTKERLEQLKKEKSPSGFVEQIIPFLNDFTGEKNEYFLHRLQGGIQRICVVGLGEEKKLNLQTVRKALGGVVSVAKKYKLTEYLVDATHSYSFSEEPYLKAIIESTILADYDWNKYKTKKPETPKLLHTLTLLIKGNPKSHEKMIFQTKIICEEANFVRDLVNENADAKTPQMLEYVSKTSAKHHKLKMTVIDKKAMQKLGMNLLLGVAQGSVHPPRLIFLEYYGNKKSKELTALVGKGVTFDTGGLNLKPTRYIETMKCDMAGAATVLGVIRAAATLKLPLNLIAVLSCAENAISATAQKPGDVLKAYNGLYVEITNTDAEGRLVLADALSYTQEKYKPTTIIDVATLTGAVMATFGSVAAGVMGTDESLLQTLIDAGKTTGEYTWPLPLYEDYEDQLKSNIADAINCVIAPYAGTITAALFLKKFITINSWVHIDIAGTAFLDKTTVNGQGGFGATGYGVRLLLEALQKKP